MRALGHELAEPIAEGVLTNLEHADIVVSGGMTYDAASVVTRARDVPHVLALMAPTTPALDGASTRASPHLPPRRLPTPILLAASPVVVPPAREWRGGSR